MSIRTERLSLQIQKEISLLLTNGEIKDPRVGMATISEVRLSKDMRHAKVFVSVFGTEEEGQVTTEVLQGARGWIRKNLGKKLRVRHIPELNFFLDLSVARAMQMEEVFSKLPAASDEETNKHQES